MTATYNPAEIERLVREAVRRACLAVERTAATAVRIEQLDAIVDRAVQESLAAMADQLEAARELLDGLSPQAIQDLVDENDRLRMAFDEAIKTLQAGGSVRSGFCCWCGQHWPQLDGESLETFRKYTVDHAEVCPAHDIRIARDAARRDLESARLRVTELEAAVERMAPVVAATEAYRDDGACYAGIVPAVDAYRAKVRGSGGEREERMP